jgi:class 3 adenylate cyclase/RecA/RadA recombinase
MTDELRPVTVLFADIVGSTDLGARLRPDEVKELIGECVTRMSVAVERFGGTVQAYQGDGICALFGVPNAHADDPERAARAALRIVEMVADYAREVELAWGLPQLAVRVGINTGETAVGTVGAGWQQEVALGDTTNVAARLEAHAEPGEVLVGRGAATQLSRRFELEPRGELAVRGRGEPVAVWCLRGVLPSGSGLAAGPSVGREREIEELRVLLDGVALGRGAIVSLVGDEGMGKSHLIEHALARADENVTRIAASCPSYAAGVPYAALAALVRAWLGVGDGAPEIVVRTRLRAAVRDAFGERADELLPKLARLLRLHDDGSPDASVSKGCLDWARGLAHERPLVLVLDDLQWLDEGSASVVEELLASTDELPILLVLAQARVARTQGWRVRTAALSDYTHRTHDLALAPLDAGPAADLVRRLAPALDVDVAAAVVERAAGNPFYIEELVRFVAGGEDLDRRRTWTITTRQQRSLPPALHSLLVARIDRLSPEARRLVQAAAVMGPTFQGSVLAELEDTHPLPELLQSGVVVEQARYPDLTYAFKHRLLQEAVLSTLTPGRRQELYREIAKVYERLFASSLDEHLERLAHYYAQAGDEDTARSYYERAGGG